MGSERTQFERIDFPRHGPWRQRTPATSRVVEPPLQARFVRDVTIFDGTEMAPGTSFTKIWTVRNDGTHEWPEDVKLQCVGGDELQAPHRVKLQHHGKVALGSEVQLAVDLVAPQRAGRYIAYFRLITPSGKKFGQRIWCSINVVDHEDAAPTDTLFTAAPKTAAAPAADETDDTHNSVRLEATDIAGAKDEEHSTESSVLSMDGTLTAAPAPPQPPNAPVVAAGDASVAPLDAAAAAPIVDEQVATANSADSIDGRDGAVATHEEAEAVAQPSPEALPNDVDT